jgi:hypothetical protein
MYFKIFLFLGGNFQERKVPEEARHINEGCIKNGKCIPVNQRQLVRE